MERNECIELLRSKSEQLRSAGEDRYPKRSDFTPEQVCAIKARLGPFPRALEAAGLKPKRSGDRLEKNREKRIRAKRSRTEARKKADKERRDALIGAENVIISAHDAFIIERSPEGEKGETK